ncbi:tellurite resistance TerB family protein [Umezakia ovalisporum]|uniref:TerB family tellurite resistance protein n=2 Tax=Umezakia ovalisporum TaxID=75695 RepID=A0AA43H0A0_9CYAN|nr:TerB family tellurite resistance protein [Umezakia ovalisporum]MBI1241178.1 TerB family tellurite resistance protein [Nostoc sp. RI_552]MDH6057754.1 TerB family tellurite resistance protein [Umezakia ovalisporum FSS-43]MDH6064786.1 TerB family tellurite resistance protein [Umezakia ovalisporum FSS-62]MDH6067386.1 TerB family tellurite resistance protein [Umezakia ovalisporum APH033B]MDH6070341.1 TerB family tellurite resistance protein [Umezakia ovalisporum CobakiLakeA]
MTNSHVKNLVKILIGAAWIDGKIQPEERQYLREIAQAKGLATDPEIKPWLYELVPVQPKECYAWVQEYLGDRPSLEDCENLIEAISGLIYSDGDVAVEEARLLTKLQQLTNLSETTQSLHTALLKQVQKLYRRWVEVQN